METKIIAVSKQLSTLGKLQEKQLYYTLKTLGRIPTIVPGIMNDFSPTVWSDRVLKLVFSEEFGERDCVPNNKNKELYYDIFSKITKPSEELTIAVLLKIDPSLVAGFYKRLSNPSEIIQLLAINRVPQTALADIYLAINKPSEDVQLVAIQRADKTSLDKIYSSIKKPSKLVQLAARVSRMLEQRRQVAPTTRDGSYFQ